MLNRNKVLIFLTLFLVVLLELNILLSKQLVFGENNSGGKQLFRNASGDRREHDYWSGKVEQQGAEEAYREFRETHKDLDPGVQHTQAHVFGEALFAKTGLDGVSVCDSSFAFGCYHSFLGLAIYTHGLQSVALLNQKCANNLRSQALGCQHGIGHGILTYLGYEYEDLIEALKLCDTLPANDPIGGCLGGVFMEYNFQTMLDVDGTTRSFDLINPNYPCDTLDEKFRDACYFWQPHWWDNVLEGEKLEIAQKIGSLCRNLEVLSQKEQCYKGFGNVLPQFAGWDVNETKRLCAQMGEEGYALCRIAAAGAFFAETQYRNRASKLCPGLTGSEYELCLREATFGGGN